MTMWGPERRGYRRLRRREKPSLLQSALAFLRGLFAPRDPPPALPRPLCSLESQYELGDCHPPALQGGFAPSTPEGGCAPSTPSSDC